MSGSERQAVDGLTSLGATTPPGLDEPHLSGFSATSGAALGLRARDDVAPVEGFDLGGTARGSIGAEALGALVVETPPSGAVGALGHDFARPLRAGLGRRSRGSPCARRGIRGRLGRRPARLGLVVGDLLFSRLTLRRGQLVALRVGADGALAEPLRDHFRDLGPAGLIDPTTDGFGPGAAAQQQQRRSDERSRHRHGSTTLCKLGTPLRRPDASPYCHTDAEAVRQRTDPGGAWRHEARRSGKRGALPFKCRTTAGAAGSVALRPETTPSWAMQPQRLWPRSSQQRKRNASSAYGVWSNAARSASFIGPPCSSRLRCESTDSAAA